MTSGRLHAMALGATVLAAALLGAPTLARALELRVMVPNLEPAGGKVVVSLYRDEAGWKSGGAPFRTVTLPVQEGRATAVFQVPEGRYAAAAFQDRNGDGKLGVLAFGWPTEPSGYSGVANRPWFGRPEWDRSDFQTQEDQRTTVFVRLD